MAKDNTLKAALREERGKSNARRLRAGGRIPAVMYGHGDETRALSVDAQELKNLFSRISVENTLINMEIEGVKGAVIPALVRDVQRHPYRPEVLHVDFYQVHAGEALDVDIPVRLVGTAEGVKEGGILEQVVHDLPISCLPSQIPNVLELDVSSLEIGDSLHVSDIALPEGVTTDMDSERTVCAVVAPSIMKVDEEEEEEAVELAGAPEGVGGEVGEPELIRRGGEESEEEED